jgi:1,4-alpha-glucan branching enzyme
MGNILVSFNYIVGVAGDIFLDTQARLHGSWDRNGHFSNDWTAVDMQRNISDDGCFSFHATVLFDEAELGRLFNWGVSFIFPQGRKFWAIPTEVKDRSSRERYRTFQLCGAAQEEYYYLTHCRRLGANKCRRADGTTGIQNAVWAQNAQPVEVVMGITWDR